MEGFVSPALVRMLPSGWVNRQRREIALASCEFSQKLVNDAASRLSEIVCADADNYKH